MASAKTKKEHVVMRNSDFFCGNCGKSYSVQYPIEPYMFSAQASAFTKQHAKCPKTWTEPIPAEGMSENERARFWIENGERGVSSETMYEVFTGRKLRKYHDQSHPYDPDDFRRCHLLLEAVPQWRARLEDLKTLGDPWPALVDNWPKLTEMLLEQMATGKRNGMWEFMRQLGT